MGYLKPKPKPKSQYPMEKIKKPLLILIAILFFLGIISANLYGDYLALLIIKSPIYNPDPLLSRIKFLGITVIILYNIISYMGLKNLWKFLNTPPNSTK